MKRQTREASSLRCINMNSSVAEAARLLAQPGVGVLIVVDGRDTIDGHVLGLLTERDIFRAVAAKGQSVSDHCVWVITDPDFPAIDVASSPRDRLEAFCDRRVDHIALMDGFSISAVLSIWDCVGSHANTSSNEPEGRPE